MKLIWQKIKQNHFLLLIICCLAPVVIILGLTFLLKGGGKSWFWLLVLLCPLLHIWLMKAVVGDKHSHGDVNEKNN